MKKVILLIIIFLVGCEKTPIGSDDLLINECPVPIENQIVEYKFNGNGSDSSTNNLDTEIIEATFDNDRFGSSNSSLNFDTSDNPSWGEIDDISITQYNNVMDADNLTLYAWVNIKDKPGDYKGRPSTIMARWDGSNNNSIFRFQVLGNGELFLQISDDISYTTNDSISFNEWNHVAVSFNNGNVKFYFNGELVQEISKDVTLTQGVSHLTIGEIWMNNGYWHHFNGNLDDVGMFNKALTACEIETLYNR